MYTTGRHDRMTTQPVLSSRSDVNISPQMYDWRHRGRKCHGIYRKVLGYVGASDEENIKLLDLAGDLSIFYIWKNPVYTRKTRLL